MARLAIFLLLLDRLGHLYNLALLHRHIVVSVGEALNNFRMIGVTVTFPLNLLTASRYQPQIKDTTPTLSKAFKVFSMKYS